MYDVTIIGGGPSGLYSAFYSGLRNLKTKLIESQSVLGGKVNLYPDKILWDVGGLTPITGKKFLSNCITQGLTFHPTVCLNTEISQITNTAGIFDIRASNGDHHYSKTVILAYGSGIITPNKLDIDGVERFERTNLHYIPNSLHAFRNKQVFLSGGGNTAIEQANELLSIAKRVTLGYRGNELRAHEHSVDAFRKNGGTLLLETQIHSFRGNHLGEIEAVSLSVAGEARTITADAVIVNHGFASKQAIGFDEALGLRFTEHHFIEGSPDSTLDCSGIFAAGDAISYTGKVNLLVGAFQDAVNAVNSVKQYLNPAAEKQAMVSSHNEAFAEKNRQVSL
ncbi:NAD(P)/FAD-dependent oxidoreductase [Trichococcus ilyis]|uniref:NAD(P)/FAD-dependent oxidoreductase n=1 Tax=Trichococcus ilyis TaxID=640938 RepID=UPI001EF73547|nr:NAD(P)/FAD-dependent oxidoreductase [Trichococcus ilyis]